MTVRKLMFGSSLDRGEKVSDTIFPHFPLLAHKERKTHEWGRDTRVRTHVLLLSPLVLRRQLAVLLLVLFKECRFESDCLCSRLCFHVSNFVVARITD